MANAGTIFIVIVNTIKCKNGDGHYNGDKELMFTFSAGNNLTFEVGQDRRLKVESLWQCQRLDVDVSWGMV